MAKQWKELAKAEPVVEPALVKFRFTCPHTHLHKHLPYTNGDEITIPAHEADWIEQMGSGHRIHDTEPKE